MAGTFRIDRVVTSGTFSLDGGTWEVDNNIWLLGDDDEVLVVDAAHIAQPQQPGRLTDGEGAGGGKRGILTQGMAGDEFHLPRQVETLGLQHAHHGERDRHQRRLGILRQCQTVLRPFENNG